MTLQITQPRTKQLQTAKQQITQPLALRFISRAALVLIAIALPFCLWAVVHIPIGSAGVHEWLPEGRPERQRYESFIQQFGNDQIVIVSWDGCRVSDKRLDEFQSQLIAIDDAQGRDDQKRFTTIETSATITRRLQEPPLKLSAREAANRIQGFMIGAEGTAAALIRVSDYGVANQDSTISMIFQAAVQTQGLGHEELIIAGTVYEAYAVDQAAEASLKKLVLPSSLLGLIVTWICLKSFRKAIVVLTLAGVGQLLAVAMVYYSGNRFSAVLIVLPTLVFMLTLSGAVHLVNYFTDCQNRLLRDQQDDSTAGFQALMMGWKPCVLSSVTTMIGMGSLWTSELSPIRQFGLFSAIGLALATLVLLLAFPAITELLLCRSEKLKKETKTKAGPISSTFVDRYTVWIQSNANWISLLSVGGLLLMMIGLSQLKASTKFSDMFPEDCKTNQDMNWIETHLGPISTVEVLLQFSSDCPLSNFDRIRALSKVSNRVLQQEQVGGVLSAVNFLPSWSESASIGAVSKRSALRSSVDDAIPELIAKQLVVENEGVQTWRLMAKVSAVADEDYGTLTRVVADATRLAMQEFPEGSNATVEFTGLSPVMHETQTILLKDLGYSFVMAFALITPVMIWISRSIIGGIVIMLPNVLPVSIAFGMMGWLQYNLDIAGILTASIALGIAVDDTLHFVCRYVESLRAGEKKEQAIIDTMNACGRAMIHTSVISCIAMAPFLFAEFLPTQQFAKLMIVMLSFAVIGDLILLPALLLSSIGTFVVARIERSSGLLRIKAKACWFLAVSCIAASSVIAAEPKTNVTEDSSRIDLSAPLADAAEARAWHLLTKLLSQDMNVDQSQADGMTALHWAVYHNNSEAVKELLRRKANVNAATRYQVTPLAIACTQLQPSSLPQLLEAGADVEFQSPGGETPLMIASRTGSAESVKQLLAYKATHQATDRNDQTALMWAASAGNVDVIDTLIQAGVDLNETTSMGLTAMMFAARDGRIEVVKRLIVAGVDVNAVVDSTKKGERVARDKTSALIFAVESGHYELAMELISAGADPNDQRNGFTCLHVISWVRKPNSGDDANGDPPPRGSGNLSDLEFVRAIVAAGADVNARLRSGFGGRAILNPRGATPLLYAARTADVPLMKILVELGADPLVPNLEGTTPMMAAAGVGVRAVNEEAGTEPEVVEAIDYLVSLGADVNTVDDNQETAMHGAAYRNFPRAVDRLAYHGANPKSWNHKNKSGWTPIMIGEGQRPGSFKPSPETVEALRVAMREKQ